MAVFLAAYDIPVSLPHADADRRRQLDRERDVGDTRRRRRQPGVQRRLPERRRDATHATAYSVAQQLVTTAWNIIFAIVVLVWAFGWTGGRQLVDDVVRRREGEGRGAEGRARRSERRPRSEGRARGRLVDEALTWAGSTPSSSLIALAAMLSPTTLSFSVLALVLGDRPLRTGFWFYLGALAATLAVGVLRRSCSVTSPRRPIRRPRRPGSRSSTSSRRSSARVGRPGARGGRRTRSRHGGHDRADGARSPPRPRSRSSARARRSRIPGGFIPIALKDISETRPEPPEYIVGWLFFSLVSLLPLADRSAAPRLARDWTVRLLERARLARAHARTIAAVILVLLAAALLRNGIAGLLG